MREKELFFLTDYQLRNVEGMIEIEKPLFCKHHCNSCFRNHQWMVKSMGEDIMRKRYLYSFNIHLSQDILNVKGK